MEPPLVELFPPEDHSDEWEARVGEFSAFGPSASSALAEAAYQWGESVEEEREEEGPAAEVS